MTILVCENFTALLRDESVQVTNANKLSQSLLLRFVNTLEFSKVFGGTLRKRNNVRYVPKTLLFG